MALLGEQILFSGDHLWWSPEHQAVVASRTYCWWDWPRQVASVAKLRDLDVRWLLPGHGNRHRFKSGQWRQLIDRTLAFCRAAEPLAGTELAIVQ